MLAHRFIVFFHFFSFTSSLPVLIIVVILRSFDDTNSLPDPTIYGGFAVGGAHIHIQGSVHARRTDEQINQRTNASGKEKGERSNRRVEGVVGERRVR